MFIRRVLTVEHPQFHHADAGAQLHRAAMPMHQPLAAVGGKPRRGGPLLLAVVVGVVGVSTRDLRLRFPVQSPAMTGAALVQSSSVAFR